MWTLEITGYLVRVILNLHIKLSVLESNIGVMLPCNIVAQEHEDGKAEVSAINPMKTMDKALSPELSELATEVSSRLPKAIDDL